MNELIPLSVLALDTGTTAAELERRHADRTLPDHLGRVCVDAELARELIAAERARVEGHAQYRRQARQTQREKVAATHPRRRVKAITEHQAQLREKGLIDADMSAFAVMGSGDTQASLDGYASRRMDAWLRGESTGGRYTIGKD
ncbi:hypothetical protein [Mycobacterium seoulense]|uniref:Uncharacterized protein n=1 Tax=Mycobacterium seoulense TaxID=386911 RepID=A0A7I7NX77_9MYCO|nr:hypothetical protein [Mycobacterium seoulense]MCV7436076.1 hypothetical protein [Mycobacterium seoulense]BBY01045.1 hypothetical protein MSEO_15440 [Mycobacterium seoulense]